MPSIYLFTFRNTVLFPASIGCEKKPEQKWSPKIALQAGDVDK